MSTLSPDHWQAVSPYLDQALEMPDEEREAWLASLREQNPTLATHLQTLLDEHRVLAQEHYLEEGPLPLLGGEALAGKTIGAYTLLSPIGQGGMGTVWLAERSDGRPQVHGQLRVHGEPRSHRLFFLAQAVPRPEADVLEQELVAGHRGPGAQRESTSCIE